MSNFDVYIGLDFGTSFSKVCYNVKGDLYVYKKKDSPFIPTEIYYNTDTIEVFNNNDIYTQQLIPVKYFKYSMVFESIINKQILNNLPANLTYKQINILFSIYFLACVIKDVKQEIINKYYKNTDIKDIVWEINMSSPINDYQGKIYNLYFDVLNSAYNLANDCQLTNIHINKINDIYNKVKNGIIIKNELLSIHPELFIEAVYLTNNNLLGLDYGSYMVMDIGGGTVDIGILWRREWRNSTKYDLVVINIIKYGVERIIDELENIGIIRKDINSILERGEFNINTLIINEYFINNIEKMIDIEESDPKIGIEDIFNKRIYYTGGGCNLLWYKNIVNSINSSKITEDKIPIKSLPLNYNNKQDAHRLIIAMELARPVDTIEMNLGSTRIINGEKIISGNESLEFEIKETTITRSKPVQKIWTYNDLQDRQKELYGDEPI